MEERLFLIMPKWPRGKKGTFSHPNWNVVYQMQSISGENSLVKTLRLQYLEALCFNFNFLKA